MEGRCSIRTYPSKKEMQRMEAIQAYSQVVQAILGFNPDYPIIEIRNAIGDAKSPDAISRALRSRLSYNLFSVGNGHNKKHNGRI